MLTPVVLLVLVTGSAAPQARAGASDTTAVVSGQVVDTTGVGIAGADVSVAGTAASALTDARGSFRLDAVPAGARTLSVRRVGYRSSTMPLTVRAGEAQRITVRLTSLPVPLDTITSEAKAMDEYLRRSGFYQRQRAGFGDFVTREEIDRMHVVSMWDVLRRIPLLEVVDAGAGRRFVVMQGGTCRPRIYLDGMRTPDLEAVPAAFVDGIEVYRHASTVPVEYGGGQACGAILVWTR